MKWTVIIFVGLAWSAAAQDLPDGAGKAPFERVCGKCHGLTGVVSQRNSRDRWGDVVDDMVSRGAVATDEEIDKIIDYLATNFSKTKPGKVSINKATAKELSTALGISDGDSQTIVTYREKNGNFKDWDDLKKVPGVDLTKVEDKKTNIEY